MNTSKEQTKRNLMQFLKSIIVGAFVLLLGSTVVAQGQRGERRGFDLEKMTEQLDLTAEQATQLKTIHEEQRTAFAKLAEGLPEGERPDREQKHALLQESRKKMMAVLTPAQQEKLKAERQNRKGGKWKHHAKMNEELRSELRDYRNETIIPTFVEVRTDFDKKLTPTERKQISTLREAVRTELGERGLRRMTQGAGAPRGHHRGGKKGHGAKEGIAQRDDKAGGREDGRAKMRAFMDTHQSEVKAVRDIVKNHQSELIAVRAELDASKVQWKKDSDAIRAKHLTAEQIAQHKAHDAKRKEMHKKHGEGEHHAKRSEREGSFSRADRGAFMFLLMDPKSLEADGFEELESEKLSVYPNPASDQTTLKFEVRSAGPVRVELIDVSGKVVQTVLEANREADLYELPVKLPASMGKTGLFRVTDVKGVRTIQVTRG